MSFNRYSLTVVLVVQIVLCCFCFNKIVFQPSQYIFQDKADGLKNYYTYQSYINEKGDEMWKFQGMNYPNGEYLFYTDNTPLFALIINAVSDHLIDLSGMSIYLFNLFVIAGFLISSFFSFKILSAFHLNKIWAVLFSLVLPWCLPQVQRFNLGHFNLTFSWVFLCVIWCLLLLYSYHVKHQKMNFKTLTGLFILILCSAFIHIYYLVICLVLTSTFFTIWAFIQWINKKKATPIFFSGIALAILAFGIFYISIASIDEYYGFRSSIAKGYGWDNWKLNFDMLFAPYVYLPTSGQIFGSKWAPLESHNYLGTGLIVGIFLSVIMLIGSRWAKLIPATVSPNRKGFFWILGLSGVVLLSISLGNHVKMFHGHLSFDNWLNPFWSLEFLTDRVKQFRCLAKFSWPFIISMHLVVIVFLLRVSSRAKLVNLLIAIVFFAYLVDSADTVLYLKRNCQISNLLSKEACQPLKKEFTDIELSQFQAVLFYPFFHVGSEDYQYTIDDVDSHSAKCFQVQLFTGLPMINSKMSRTALTQTHSVFNALLDTLSTTFYEDLPSNKPILVYQNMKYYKNSLVTNWTEFTQLQPARKLLINGHQLIEKKEMTLLRDNGISRLYQWDITNNKDVVKRR